MTTRDLTTLGQMAARATYDNALRFEVAARLVSLNARLVNLTWADAKISGLLDATDDGVRAF